VANVNNRFELNYWLPRSNVNCSYTDRYRGW